MREARLLKHQQGYLTQAKGRGSGKAPTPTPPTPRPPHGLWAAPPPLQTSEAQGATAGPYGRPQGNGTTARSRQALQPRPGGTTAHPPHSAHSVGGVDGRGADGQRRELGRVVALGCARLGAAVADERQQVV